MYLIVDLLIVFILAIFIWSMMPESPKETETRVILERFGHTRTNMHLSKWDILLAECLKEELSKLDENAQDEA